MNKAESSKSLLKNNWKTEKQGNLINNNKTGLSLSLLINVYKNKVKSYLGSVVKSNIILKYFYKQIY